MARLRRVDPNRPGWTRKRHGSGFSYLDADGNLLTGADRRRCQELVIPPAWTDVWICPWPNGHLQAVGTDAAGRRQYLYHPLWRAMRDEMKHERVLEFGRALPEARPIVAEHLALPGMPRERALATGFRMLDLGALRMGGEQYAQDNGTVGVATIRRDHVATRRGTVRLAFPGKSGRNHHLVLEDPELTTAVRALLARRSGGPELLAYQQGGRWVDVGSTELNEYIRDVTGMDASAKDFRTWHGALHALSALSAAEAGERPARAVARAMRVVSEHLGNTPAVARSAYVHPGVVEAFLRGKDLPAVSAEEDEVEQVEQALLELLDAG